MGITIDKAIKVLEEFRIPNPGEEFQDIDDALKLGAEGLKVIKEQRSGRIGKYIQLLPSETEE